MFTDEAAAIYITAIGTFIALFLSVTLFIFFISYQKRKFKYTREKQQLQVTFQQELLRTKLEIQEQTFHNISQEIHDNIGQMLSLVKLDLNTADVTHPQTATEKISRSKELVSKAIADLRDLSKSLNPEIIMRIGLSEALQRELLLVAKTGQFEANLSQNGDPVRLNPQKELIIFRIFQEILNNIMKHSKAKTVDVVVEYEPRLFMLTVADDGEGFDVDRLEADETYLGLGLHNMRNRAKLIEADFQLKSTLGQGTFISIRLPI